MVQPQVHLRSSKYHIVPQSTTHSRHFTTPSAQWMHWSAAHLCLPQSAHACQIVPGVGAQGQVRSANSWPRHIICNGQIQYYKTICWSNAYKIKSTPPIWSNMLKLCMYIYMCVCVFSLVAPTILEVLSGVVCVPGNAKLWGNQVLFLPGFMIFI